MTANDEVQFGAGPIFSPKHKLIICTIEKVACTEWRKLVVRLNGSTSRIIGASATDSIPPPFLLLPYYYNYYNYGCYRYYYYYYYYYSCSLSCGVRMIITPTPV